MSLSLQTNPNYILPQLKSIAWRSDNDCLMHLHLCLSPRLHSRHLDTIQSLGQRTMYLFVFEAQLSGIRWRHIGANVHGRKSRCLKLVYFWNQSLMKRQWGNSSLNLEEPPGRRKLLGLNNAGSDTKHQRYGQPMTQWNSHSEKQRNRIWSKLDIFGRGNILTGLLALLS